MTDEPTAEEMARTLRSEAAKVRRWLRKSARHFEARQYAGYDTHEEAQNGIIQDYEHQIADYRRTVDAYVDADRLSDTSTCPKLPKASGAQPGLVCYTRADIQEKVAESLALAAECDQLAIRYKAVVRAYESVRADR